ncbi:hypothetical protein [Flavobacterium sp. N1994]|uniref:hypothetical protein n=1 Tax=Flavobacterium sp. N1994 TaxID=2986827 RepID=UPI0022233E55|nr:hypothetical protein [Flavobacterium sp. N1994]
MRWSTIDFTKLIKISLPIKLRTIRTLAFFKAMVAPLQTIQQETLYKMQHNGTKIYLEKMLNETFNVSGYDNQNHEATKLIYIEDLPGIDKLYVWQNLEADSSFFEDDGDDNDDDLFLDGDTEGALQYSWTIFMPNTITFNENSLRALVDSYRYIGKKYTIQTYIP